MIVKNLKSEDLIINEQKMMEEIVHKNLEEIADFGSENRKLKVEFLVNLNEDDIVELIQGKSVGDIKLSKEERRELKFLVKSSPPWQQVIQLLKRILFKEESKMRVKGKKHK